MEIQIYILARKLIFVVNLKVESLNLIWNFSHEERQAGNDITKPGILSLCILFFKFFKNMPPYNLLCLVFCFHTAQNDNSPSWVGLQKIRIIVLSFLLYLIILIIHTHSHTHTSVCIINKVYYVLCTCSRVYKCIFTLIVLIFYPLMRSCFSKIEIPAIRAVWAIFTVLEADLDPETCFILLL